MRITIIYLLNGKTNTFGKKTDNQSITVTTINV
jgi:hypothetical protein